jgi:hypothetical protein
MMRTRFEPGWRWSEGVRPVVGGDSCQIDDFEYCISGRMHGVMDDGDERLGRAVFADAVARAGDRALAE